MADDHTATPDDVARWMLAELEKDGDLHQVDAVQGIRKRFGDRYLYETERGGDGIAPAVLQRFRKLHGGRAEYIRRAQCWTLDG